MLSTARYIQTMKIDLCSKEVTMGHIPKRLISSAISISTYWYLNSWFCRRDSVSRSFIFGRYKMELTSNYKTYRKAICVCRYISLLLHVNVIWIFIWVLSFAIFLQSRKTRNWRPTKFSTNKEDLTGKEIERRDLILAPLNPLMLGSNLPLVYISRTKLGSCQEDTFFNVLVCHLFYISFILMLKEDHLQRQKPDLRKPVPIVLGS